MNIQQNCHMAVLCTGETDASISEENKCYQEGIEIVSGNSKSLRILEEFKRIYQERLLKIDEETPGEGTELKLKTLTSWINDLGEQNLMLVETVEQLEREAADRVALLEERLKRSSHIALDYMSKLEECDNQLLNQFVEKNHSVVLPIKTSSKLMKAQQTEEILKTRISNLQNDISGLLELIRRARYEGSWDTNGLSFLEVTYEDIFGLYPHQVTDSLEKLDCLQTTISMLQQKLGRALDENHSKDEEVKLLQDKVACQQADIVHKDLQIKNLLEKIQELQSSSSSNAKETTLGTEASDGDISVLKNFHSSEQDEGTLLNQRSIALETKKKGVSFASPTKEDYKLQVQDLQRALKQAQNGAGLARKQKDQHCGCLSDKVVFAKQVEECRVNVVLAQAAIEETVEELETVTDILLGREEKIHELEIEIEGLQNALIHSQQDITILLKPVICDDEHIINAGEPSLSCLTKVQALSELLKSFRNDFMSHHEKGLVTLSIGSECKSLPDDKSFKEIQFILEELSLQEKKVSQRYFEINNFEDKLKRLCSTMKDTLKNTEEYIRDKEVSYNSQKQSEQKIKKLLMELESVQEDLEQSLKTFEPTFV